MIPISAPMDQPMKSKTSMPSAVAAATTSAACAFSPYEPRGRDGAAAAAPDVERDDAPVRQRLGDLVVGVGVRGQPVNAHDGQAVGRAVD